jgi:hypothetical protein
LTGTDKKLRKYGKKFLTRANYSYYAQHPSRGKLKQSKATQQGRREVEVTKARKTE